MVDGGDRMTRIREGDRTARLRSGDQMAKRQRSLDENVEANVEARTRSTEVALESAEQRNGRAHHTKCRTSFAVCFFPELLFLFIFSCYRIGEIESNCR